MIGPDGLGAIADVRLASLAHNLARVRQLCPGCRVMAVVKGDAYGHGLIRAARALGDADAFAVARLAEARALREAGIGHPVVLLPGVLDAEELGQACLLGLDVVVHAMDQLALIEHSHLPHPVAVWIKVDTGMHRLGVKPGELREVHRRLQAVAAVARPVRVMTHLADADQRALEQTGRQIRCFTDATAGLETEPSIANSAGILAWPRSRVGWVRPGIMLYGVSPFFAEPGEMYGLEPAMRLRTRLMAVNRIEAGLPVGYGGRWLSPEPMWLGAAAIGYADGFPRNAPNGVVVRVGEACCVLAGRVSMDTITLDLRSAPGATVGDEVTVWGPGLAVETLAARCDTIGYELLCRVGTRVPRIEV